MDARRAARFALAPGDRRVIELLLDLRRLAAPAGVPTGGGQKVTHHRQLLAIGVFWALLMVALVFLTGADGRSYQRAEWGGWTTEDCRDTRTQVLLRDAKKRSVLWRDGTGPEGTAVECEIAYGKWVDFYTGQAYVGDPSGLDIDHLVALGAAPAAGGGAWPPARKQTYANNLRYRRHLVVTHAGVNRAKGDRGPDRWRPPDRAAWCGYAESWSAIKTVEALRTTEPEWLALREMLKTCGNPDVRTLLDPPQR